MPTDTSTAVRPAPAGASSWAPIVALASGIAVLVASEFLPAGVLPALAADIGVSEGTAGLAMAATAIAGAFTAPSIAILLPRTDRRRVLVGLLLVATVSNLVVLFAPSFAVLLVGRLLLGVALAGYWSFAFGAGMHAVPGKDNVVSASLAFGVGLATVLGLPIASLVGDEIGWRVVFGGATAFSLVSAVAVATTLPPVPAHPSAGLRMMRDALANRRLLIGVAGVLLVAFGNFAAYPYIRVATDRIEPSGTTWLLLTWGVAGVVGTVAAGALAGWLRALAASTPVVLALGLALTAAAPTLPVLVISIVLWGLAFNAVPVFTQLWLTRVETEHAEAAMALQVTAFQVAITIGSATGGALLDGHGIRVPLLVGATTAAGAGLVWALTRIPRD